ncbi:Dephospho-CoA kinase (plasmid) [Marinovum algicola DG 898]|nr:Dephospho-CoA kinase [Marinovum algicola DG 898]
MSDGLIIAVCGDSGAGKSTTTGLLRDEGFAPYSLSAFLRQEAEAAIDTPTREQVQSHGKNQQERHGNHYYAEVLIAKTDLMAQRRAVIDGLRNLDELEHLRRVAKDKGLRLVLLALVLDTESRFQRVQGRARAGDPAELERFRKDDARANGGDGVFQNNAELITAADVRIENTGDLDTLRGNLRTVLERAGAIGERQGSA